MLTIIVHVFLGTLQKEVCGVEKVQEKTCNIMATTDCSRARCSYDLRKSEGSITPRKVWGTTHAYPISKISRSRKINLGAGKVDLLPAQHHETHLSPSAIPTASDKS